MAEGNNVRCCPDPSIAAEVDYAVVFLTAEPALLRFGIKDQNVAPHPRIEPMAHQEHHLTLYPPLPLPAYRYPLDGDPPPDRGETQDWLDPTS